VSQQGGMIYFRNCKRKFLLRKFIKEELVFKKIEYIFFAK